MICNVCKHDVRQIGKEWKCDQGCRCLMLGCVAVDKPVDVELPIILGETRRMRMPCVGCGKHNAMLGQMRCRDCKRAFKAFDPEVRVWIDNVELPDNLPEELCNCTVIDQFHARGESGCIHMRPSPGVVNR